ncbi:MAG: hypothetical protein EXS31_02510 [Pedosphaera sp.]|nr:hypothetical protein [Pedosphaera sp.]
MPPSFAAAVGSSSTNKLPKAVKTGCLGCLAIIVIAIILGIVGAIIDSMKSTETIAKTQPPLATDPDEASRKQYAGVYATISGPVTFAGGLGLFQSGSYVLMFGESGSKHTGTWKVEGETIRLKGEASGDTVLKILDSDRLLYEKNGIEVVWRLRE